MVPTKRRGCFLVRPSFRALVWTTNVQRLTQLSNATKSQPHGKGRIHQPLKNTASSWYYQEPNNTELCLAYKIFVLWHSMALPTQRTNKQIVLRNSFICFLVLVSKNSRRHTVLKFPGVAIKRMHYSRLNSNGKGNPKPNNRNQYILNLPSSRPCSSEPLLLCEPLMLLQRPLSQLFQRSNSSSGSFITPSSFRSIGWYD